MLIPRFSLRGLLGLITICGAVFSIASFAFRGQRWAIAVIGAIGSLLIVAAIHVTVFIVTWLLTQVFPNRFRETMPRSPFAGDSPSPQVIAPTEPD